MRLDKFLSNLKYGSRKEIKNSIRKGLVKVNDNIIYDSDYKLDLAKDIIYFDGEKVFYKEEITLMMNKPKGYVSSNFDNKDKTIIELLKEPYNRFEFYICGRLDKDTTGLIILSTNPKVQHEITHPNQNKYKKYLVTVNKEIKENDLNRLSKGVEIEVLGKPYLTKEAKVEIIDEYNFYLEIVEGKFHQVKKMVEVIDNKVIELRRIKIGDVILDESLKEGEYKEINWE